jgi:hypothetical protein
MPDSARKWAQDVISASPWIMTLTNAYEAASFGHPMISALSSGAASDIVL